MRTIYVNQELVRFETGCGLRPLHKCPIQVWAEQPNITATINRILPWRPVIRLWTYDDPSRFSKQVQNLCDSCCYGEAFKIRQKQQASR